MKGPTLDIFFGTSDRKVFAGVRPGLDKIGKGYAHARPEKMANIFGQISVGPSRRDVGSIENRWLEREIAPFRLAKGFIPSSKELLPGPSMACEERHLPGTQGCGANERMITSDRLTFEFATCRRKR
jgi:hypothetical protein